MKPFTRHDGVVAGGGAKPPIPDSENIERRSVLFEDLPNFRGGREPTSNSNKRSYSKDSKSVTGRGNAYAVSRQTTEKTSTAPEGFSDTVVAGSVTGAALLTGTSSTSAAAAAAGDPVGMSPSPNAATVGMLHSTLLRLKTRKLPVGPLPKMDEVIARFMNISPKQWQLLNSTIDELNGRFKQGGLHWLLLRWLVAAHPEQFFPPPFNSYQQLLQQVSQKDAEVEEARKDAIKWRETCVRLEAERERWKDQLQQMEEEVSGLYTALAERRASVVTKEGRVKQQSTQQRSDVAGGTTDMEPIQDEALKDTAQQPQQQPYQLKHQEQQQQRQHQTQQDVHHKESEEQQYNEDLQEHDDQKDKQHAALLLPQLAHPVSFAESARSCEQPAGGDGSLREGEKKTASSTNLPCATTTTRTKTTVTTTTKSSTTSSHSICVTKDTDPAPPSSMDASNQQLREIAARKAQSVPQTDQHVCDRGRAGGDVSLASLLACMQNLLRRLTAENNDSSVVSPSGPPSPREEDPELSCCNSPARRHLTKRQGRKVQKKNVELWYLQYEQQNGPSAGPEEDKRKKKLQIHQDKRDKDKKKKHQEQRKHQQPHGRDHPAPKEEDEQDDEEEKHQHDVPFSAEKRESVDVLTAVGTPRSGADLAGEKGLDSQRGDTQTDGPKVEQQRANIPSCSPSSTPKPPTSSLSAANAAVTQACPASAMPRQLSPADNLFHVNQHIYPVKAYIRRFLALYKGGEHIPETIATRIFIDNLKPDLRQYVQLKHPTSLGHAILLARQAERCAAASAAPLSSVRTHTGDSSSHDNCGLPPPVTIRDCHAPTRGKEVDGENGCAESSERRLKDCRLSAIASCVNSQGALAEPHRYKTHLHKNEPITNRENARYQWQRQQHETGEALQSQPQQQQEQQLLQEYATTDGDIWHSSEDTIHSSGGDFLTPAARRDVQQQRYEEEEHQKVVTQQERTIVIPRPGTTKQHSTESTHVVGRLLTGINQRIHPRDS